MLFVLDADGVPSVARWVHVSDDPPPSAGDATHASPAAALAAFGASSGVAIVSRRVRLRDRAVVVRLRNGNAFDVPVSGRLRLAKGSAAVTRAARLGLMLPAGKRADLRIALGRARSALVRRHGRMHATLSLVVRDPAGHTRTSRRTISIVAGG
jgi:hypothetical protein